MSGWRQRSSSAMTQKHKYFFQNSACVPKLFNTKDCKVKGFSSYVEENYTDSQIWMHFIMFKCNTIKQRLLAP